MKSSANSTHKPLFCNFRVSVCLWAIFKVRIKVTVYVSLKISLTVVLVRSDEFTRKAGGHFVTLTEIGMHLITYISVYITGEVT